MTRKMSETLNRANLSRKDFEEAEDYLRAYRDELPDSLKRAVLIAAVITYARPFTENNRGTLKLATATLTGNPKQILSDEEFMLHKTVLSLRNEALAHSDYDRKPTRFVARVGTGFLAKSKPFDVLAEGINVATFLSMSVKMQNHSTDLQSRLSRDLGSESTET